MVLRGEAWRTMWKNAPCRAATGHRPEERELGLGTWHRGERQMPRGRTRAPVKVPGQDRTGQDRTGQGHACRYRTLVVCWIKPSLCVCVCVCVCACVCVCFLMVYFVAFVLYACPR